MMNSVAAKGAPNSTSRILVVVDIHSQLIAPLEVAVAMANARRTGVVGMCVDNPDLQQTAGLPFSQEVMLLGGRTRMLEGRQLKQSMERFQARFRLLLAERAESESIPWSVSTISGTHQVWEQHRLHTSDVLILGKPAQIRSPAQKTKKILLLADNYEALLPTLEVLLKLNVYQRNEILLPSQNNLDSEAPLRLQEVLGSHQNTLVRAISLRETKHLCAAGSSKLAYILAAQDTQQETLDQIIRQASCPVILTH